MCRICDTFIAKNDDGLFTQAWSKCVRSLRAATIRNTAVDNYINFLFHSIKRIAKRWIMPIHDWGAAAAPNSFSFDNC